MSGKRKAILHIGTEKTGTSTLQTFLSRNRERLNANGFHYPRFAGAINHTRLGAYAAADEVRDDLRIDIGVTDAEALAAFRSRLDAEAAEEVAAHPGRTFVFSNEHCSSRLTTPAEIARLRDFLARHFDEVTVTVYLRRQDMVAVSLYSTLLKFGGDRREILPDPSLRPDYWDYGSLLARWAQAFGRGAVVPCIFDRAGLAGGSVVADFVERWGLGGGLEPVANANESLQPAAQEVLRRLNTAFPGYVDGDLNRMRGELGYRFGKLFAGRGLRPSRVEAEAFYRHFAEANEACRAEWFPGRSTLFDEDFSAYPEEADPREVSFEQTIGIMRELWRETQANELRLRHDLALREGQIAELEGDLGAAAEAYGRAVRIDPGRPLARRRLARVEEAREAARRERETAPCAGGDAPGPGPAWAGESAPAGVRAAIRSRWTQEEHRAAEMKRLRKRLSLNGIRRLIGVRPR